MDFYHTALKSVHDLFTGPLPEEYRVCDVFYTDLPWQAGFQAFEQRVGAQGRSYREFMATVSCIVRGLGVCCVLVTGRHALKHLPIPEAVMTSTLNGSPCLLVVYHAHFDRHFWTTIDLLHYLAEHFQCVGDFCCGYGRAGLIFTRHGKRFVMSDYNPRCISYIGATL